MEFRILGPLEVCDEGGRTLDIGGKQRALLALLLLNANEAVSTDRLIEDLWDGNPPDTAAKALQVYVSQLRKLLGRDRLQTRPPGYLLRVEPDELDVERFRRLQDNGKLQEALSLCRGPPLSDFADERFAQAEIGRLEELRLACLEERIEQDIAEGRHADLVGELEALVAKQPLRERLRAQLMLALYRSRRQAEALEAYQQARKALVDELGIEPSPELQDLERRILRQDATLELEPRPSARPAGPSTRHAAGTFVAREWELATLEAGLADAEAGRGRLFLLVGEAGIGKSRLADEFAAQAKDRGALILWGRCWEAGGAPAYWPWVQSLRTYVRGRAPDALRAELGSRAPELAQLLPELEELDADPTPTPALDPDSARFRLFDSVAAFLRSAARDRTLVLVLDDLHVADEPSLLLLRFLAGELAEIPIVLIGTYREEDAVEDEPVSASLSELRRLPCRHIQLGGLAAEHVATYIRLATGVTPPQRLVDAIHTETEGNPLFVGEVVRLLAAEGRLSEPPEPGWRLQIPPGLHEVIARRLRGLSKECRRVLTLASVLGREFSLEALEQLSDATEDELLEVLDEAFAARVLADVPGAVGRLRFSHARVRDALYDDMSLARRAQLHRRIGEALEELYRGDLEPHVAELAHHFFLAGPGGDVDKTIEYTRRAGDLAVAVLAYEEAVRHYEMALRALDRRASRDNAETGSVLLALGDAQARAGDTPGSKESFRKAADLPGASNRPEQLARAALGYGGRIIWEVFRDDDYLVPLLERALAAIGEEDSALRVRLLARLAGGPLRDASFPPERKAALSREALDMARRLDDPPTLAYALAGYIPANHSPTHTYEQIELSTELIEVAGEVGDLERAIEGYEARAAAWLELGAMPRAKADLGAMAKLAGELRQPSQAWYVAEQRAQHALLEGRFVEADRLIHEALELGELSQRWSARVSYRMQLYLVRRHQGRLDELAETFEAHRGAFHYRTYPVFDCILARFYDELGRGDEARIRFEAVAVDDFAGLPFDEEWLLGMSLLAETATSLGDSRRAGALYRKLLPYADRVAVGVPEISVGAVSRYLGLLGQTIGRRDEAARHFEDALAVNERIGARPWLAHTQYDYAGFLLARDAPGDAQRGRDLLASCLATCRELGMPALAERAARLSDGRTGSGTRATATGE
jgi:DNA-binding SARP family transcriptional activator/tetratricopeptide (TPR) repeat protein